MTISEFEHNSLKEQVLALTRALNQKDSFSSRKRSAMGVPVIVSQDNAFAVGDVVFDDTAETGEWILANNSLNMGSDYAVNEMVGDLGVVTQATSTNFVVVTQGICNIGGTQNLGAYWLSATPGQVTDTMPGPDGGYLQRMVYYAINGAGLIYVIGPRIADGEHAHLFVPGSIIGRNTLCSSGGGSTAVTLNPQTNEIIGVLVGGGASGGEAGLEGSLMTGTYKQGPGGDAGGFTFFFARRVKINTNRAELTIACGAGATYSGTGNNAGYPSQLIYNGSPVVQAMGGMNPYGGGANLFGTFTFGGNVGLADDKWEGFYFSIPGLMGQPGYDLVKPGAQYSGGNYYLAGIAEQGGLGGEGFNGGAYGGGGNGGSINWSAGTWTVQTNGQNGIAGIAILQEMT